MSWQVCTLIGGMKRGELERKLRDLGWALHSHRGKHDLWKHSHKSADIFVPRHAIIKMGTARGILRDAAK